MEYGCTSEDSNLKWDFGKKKDGVFLQFLVDISGENENIPK